MSFFPSVIRFLSLSSVLLSFFASIFLSFIYLFLSLDFEYHLARGSWPTLEKNVLPLSSGRKSKPNRQQDGGSAFLLGNIRVVSHHITSLFIVTAAYIKKKTKTKLRGLSPRANYTDRETVASRRS
jgi:hypothetical protein